MKDQILKGVPSEPEHPTKTTKLINWFIAAALIVVAIGLAIILKWSFANENVLQVKNSPFPVRTIRNHPTAAGVVILKVNLCKNSDVSGKIRTSFVSKTREIFLPLSDEKFPKSCLNREIPILMPYDLPPDTYKIRFRAEYDLNPLKRDITSEFESREFIVDPVR